MSELLTNEEVFSILDQPKRESTIGERDYLILCMLIFEGLEFSEIVSLRWEDIDFTKRQAVIDDVYKDGDSIKVILVKETIVLLSGWLSTQKGLFIESDYVITSLSGDPLSKYEVEDIVVDYTIDAGIHRNISEQLIRLSVANLIYKNTRDLEVVQIYLRHNKISDTNRLVKNGVITLEEDISIDGLVKGEGATQYSSKLIDINSVAFRMGILLFVFGLISFVLSPLGILPIRFKSYNFYFEILLIIYQFFLFSLIFTFFKYDKSNIINHVFSSLLALLGFLLLLSGLTYNHEAFILKNAEMYKTYRILSLESPTLLEVFLAYLRLGVNSITSGVFPNIWKYKLSFTESGDKLVFFANIIFGLWGLEIAMKIIIRKYENHYGAFSWGHVEDPFKGLGIAFLLVGVIFIIISIIYPQSWIVQYSEFRKKLIINIFPFIRILIIIVLGGVCLLVVVDSIRYSALNLFVRLFYFVLCLIGMILFLTAGHLIVDKGYSADYFLGKILKIDSYSFTSVIKIYGKECIDNLSLNFFSIFYNWESPFADSKLGKLMSDLSSSLFGIITKGLIFCILHEIFTKFWVLLLDGLRRFRKEYGI